MENPKQFIYIGLGTIFLILGAIGCFLPLLPTTPFWLLTCWFYMRGSKPLYDRVMRNRYFGSYVRAYVEDKTIPLRSKIVSVSVMWISMLFTIIYIVENGWIKILLLLIAVAVTYHILSFPTRKQ